jgi:hypothetical protein
MDIEGCLFPNITSGSFFWVGKLPKKVKMRLKSLRRGIPVLVIFFETLDPFLRILFYKRSKKLWI